MDYDVIVIGAGSGGLSAGGVLASQGLKTLIIEKSNNAGGCASSFTANGYQFDVGACIIEVPWVHDWFYERIGRRREDYVKFIENDPLYELVDTTDGNRYLMPASFEGVAELISRCSPRDAESFLKFCRKQGSIMDRFSEVMMQTPQGRISDMIKLFVKYPRILGSMKYIMSPYSKLMEDLFEHPFTRRLLGTPAVIGGLPPSLQSGFMFWQCYAEHEGMYYPEGGMGAVPRGMATAFREFSGELMLESEVKRVLVEKGRARGVVLTDGTVIASKAVVSNANSKTLYERMIGEPDVPKAVIKGLNSYGFSPSCAVGYLGLDCELDLRAQHMMVLADSRLLELFWSKMFDEGIAPGESVGLISSPTYVDPALAPEGHSVLTFITMAPRHLKGLRWNDIKWDYLEKGINMVDSFYIPGIKDHITFKTIATPEDFEKRINLLNGSIYAYSMSIMSQMLFRPGNRSRCIRGLYLCGASTHMGSVPGAVASGIMTADLALNEFGKAA
ncbi:MAG: NAD(P)/FAD-dependent oxidoreductase [Actinobacteria bacterium]|nr:NAD(P)/FAD-dependent oxidoreductase [Actinomycetota bacterium]